MNILVIGAGGREHTLAWKIRQSNHCGQLYVAPGNPGTAAFAQNVNLNPMDFEAVGAFALDNQVDMVVVGPEDPLAGGIVDYFHETPSLKGINIFGPGKAGAELESSKDFSKKFMQRHDIPTAGYRSFTADELDEGIKFINSFTGPVVLKADGLAAGKGVIITEDKKEAEATLREMLIGGKFGDAGNRVVIEEFLDGIELSVFVITNGKEYVVLPEAKDYKRIGEGDIGLNTGGMGAVSPVPFVNEVFLQKIASTIIEPTIKGLQDEQIPYTGFIFFGLIKVDNEPYVIEYNVRMGDPETQAVIPRLQNDLVELLQAAFEGNLSQQHIQFDHRVAATRVLVSGGYPEAYEKGKVIKGLGDVEDALVFHAGTKEAGDDIVTNGGRVLGITAMGEDMSQALERMKVATGKIQWENMYYRKDIGRDLLSLA